MWLHRVIDHELLGIRADEPLGASVVGACTAMLSAGNCKCDELEERNDRERVGEANLSHHGMS
jgi:hypothetical protein